jgi:signal transduction histidine kinase
MPKRGDFDTSPTLRVGLGQPDTDRDPVRPIGRLVCLVGGVVGTSYVLADHPLVIGRDPAGDIVVQENDVSRQHARIVFRDARFWIEDLRSSNGTTVNGIAIEKQALRIGDRIGIGRNVLFVFTQPDDVEERAQRLQKLELMSRLAASVVHDFKNALGAAAPNLELMREHVKERYPGDAELMAMIDDVTSAISTGASVTARLLTFARRDRPATSICAVADVVRDTLAMAGSLLGPRIAVSSHISPSIRVMADAEELRAALLNLFVNARDAMPTGGRLTITGRVRSLDRAEALAMHLRSEGDYVELNVIDTGIGMTDEVRARIFEPFFTTKPAGQGTGLGLPTVYGFTRRLGGNVLVDSDPAKGSTFKLLLPAAVM